MTASDKIHEECGVFGVYCTKKEDVATITYYGLYALQHRGQESCGIVVNDDGVFNSYKDLGIVNDVFTKEHLSSLGEGNIAVGHVRYGTTGATNRLNCQPIEINHIKGHLALAHNGNLTNAYNLRRELEMRGSIFHTTSDTEIISYIITQERLHSASIEEAICRAMYRLEGAYSLVIMSPSKLIAARDKRGFRPLCYGLLPDGSYIVTSESCALDAVGAKFIRDIEPGEIIVFSEGGNVVSITEHCKKAAPSHCIFEYIYFARPDSVIDGVSVHNARKNAGMYLAKEYPVDADVVIGVPDSGIDAAIGYAEYSGIPYGIGLIKNKYIGRTFISPGQKMRENMVRIKLNPIAEAIKGKKVVLIDDSIVRGTTSARIVKLVRDAGAKEIHMRISSPPFVAPCYYGTDIDSKENLIACHHSVEEIRDILKVDTLGYLKLEDLVKIAGKENSHKFCKACFDEDYPTKTPSDNGKSRFETKISDNKSDNKK